MAENKPPKFKRIDSQKVELTQLVFEDSQGNPVKVSESNPLPGLAGGSGPASDSSNVGGFVVTDNNPLPVKMIQQGGAPATRSSKLVSDDETRTAEVGKAKDIDENSDLLGTASVIVNDPTVHIEDIVQVSGSVSINEQVSVVGEVAISEMPDVNLSGPIDVVLPNNASVSVVNTVEVTGEVSLSEPVESKIVNESVVVKFPSSQSVTISNQSVPVSGSVSITGTSSVNITNPSVPVAGTVSISGTPSVNISNTSVPVQIQGIPGVSIANTVGVTGSVSLSSNPTIAGIASTVTVTDADKFTTFWTHELTIPANTASSFTFSGNNSANIKLLVITSDQDIFVSNTNNVSTPASSQTPGGRRRVSSVAKETQKWWTGNTV